MITLDLPERAGEKYAELGLAALRGFFGRAQKAVQVEGQVSVSLTSDRAVRRLNEQFRGKPHATDVLSFPAYAVNGKSRSAGDLAISLDTAARQAKRFGHSLETEVKILLLHGLLHLAGYDHESDAGEMAEREEALRRRFRLPCTLIARASAAPSRATRHAR